MIDEEFVRSVITRADLGSMINLYTAEKLCEEGSDLDLAYQLYMAIPPDYFLGKLRDPLTEAAMSKVVVTLQDNGYFGEEVVDV